MKTRSHSNTVSLKSPAGDFINTVTNFHNDYVRGHDKHHGNRKISAVYTTSSSDPNDITKTTPALANFLLIYFETLYFLLACPFKIGRDEKGKFAIKKHRFHTVLCAVMNLFCFIRVMTEVRSSIEKEYRCKSASKNPVQYFTIIMDVSSFIYKTTTMKRFWFNQTDYLNILTYIDGKSLLRENSRSIKFYQTKFFLRTVFGLAVMHAFTSFFVGKGIIGQSYSWSPALWSNQLVKLARYTFCLDKNFDINDSSPLETTKNFDLFVTILMSISLLQRLITGLFCDLCLLFHAITLWMAAKSFSLSIDKDIHAIMQKERRNWGGIEEESHENGKIKSTTKPGSYDNQPFYEGNEEDEEDMQWPDVYRRFRVVQKLSMTINIALGGQVTWYMAEAVMYYSVSLNKFLTSMDVFVRVDLAIFYFTTFGILFISADICSQMERVKIWISFGENRKTIPADEFSIVLHEMLAKDIGTRGSNVFTITYSLLALFFSTIVTYFIICVQQGGDSSFVFQTFEGNVTRC